MEMKLHRELSAACRSLVPLKTLGSLLLSKARLSAIKCEVHGMISAASSAAAAAPDYATRLSNRQGFPAFRSDDWSRGMIRLTISIGPSPQCNYGRPDAEGNLVVCSSNSVQAIMPCSIRNVLSTQGSPPLRLLR